MVLLKLWPLLLLLSLVGWVLLFPLPLPLSSLLSSLLSELATVEIMDGRIVEETVEETVEVAASFAPVVDVCCNLGEVTGVDGLLIVVSYNVTSL